MEFDLTLCNKLRPVSRLEQEEMELLCSEYGILDKLKVWECDGVTYLIDGRTRYKAAQKLGLKFDVEHLAFQDIAEAEAFVFRNQLGRRNSSDADQTSYRAALAQIIGTEAAAEVSGMSRRTIERDIERMNSMELMSDDVRERCESGEIINSKRDWKRYADLSDDERKAVDQKLRDNSITLRQALPSEKQVKLSAEDFELINQCPHLSGHHKQALTSGDMYAEPKNIKEFMALKPEQQAVVAFMLDDPEVANFGDALKAFRNKAPELPMERRIQAMREAAVEYCEKLKEKVLDYAAVSNIQTDPYTQRIEAMLSEIYKWK